jgi:hypothetical protein
LSVTWTSIKNLIYAFRELLDPPRRVVIRTWLAVFAGGLGSAGALFCPWPWILPAGILAAVLDWFSLQVVYAAADWFFIEGRHYEKGDWAKS